VRRLAALALAVLLGSGGCGALTGRPAGRWADDRLITAKVKALLAVGEPAMVTRVHVDTYDGVVYLTGGVESAETKAEAEQAAASVPGVGRVVNNIHVVFEDGGEAASALPGSATLDAPPRPRALAGVRLEWETGTPAWRRYAGYDAAGARVATVYAVRAADVTGRGVGDLSAEGRVVDHVGVYPGDQDDAWVVLWHVRR